MKVSVINQVRDLVRRTRAFAAEKRGNIAMIFAIAIIPLLLAGGAGIDLSRALTARNALQAATDAAALAVATAPAGTTNAQKTIIAQNYFNANYKLDSTFGAPTAVNVSLTSQQAVVTTTNDVPTTLMKIALIDHVPLNTSSTVVWGQTKLWVSLVLDNTGSMLDPDGGGPNSKIAATKQGTHDMLALLQTASANAGDVKVALIPFSKDVNVGTGNFTQSWIDWTGWDNIHGSCSLGGSYTTQTACESASTGGSCSVGGWSSQSTCQAHGTCSISGYTTQSTCQAATTGSCSNPLKTTQNSCQTVKACTKPAYTTKSPCQNNGGVWGFGTWTTVNGIWTVTGNGVWTPGVWTAPVNGVWTADNHNTWNGCVTDRGDTNAPNAANYDTNNTAPGASAASKFPAEQFNGCTQPIMQLNYDWTALSTAVDNMVATGNTNQTIGLAWGLHAQTDALPLNAGSLPANTTQIIVLMSDGFNTQNRWTGSQSAIDARMALMCQNAKAAGAIIYSVDVDTSGDGKSQVLADCATGGEFGGKFTYATAASQIVTAFNAIGTEITNMRVSH